MRLAVPYAALMLATLLAAPAGAQQNAADIEVKGGDVLRTCREVHRAAQAQEPDAVVTPQGITFNCRLVNANGSTIAQVSPEEVCERLTGSREWRRGDGTQVYCNADGVKTRAIQPPCPQPTDEQIVAEDVSRACQKVHRAGNASAEPLRMSVGGPEFNCRLSNSAGFTIAGVSPEQVCEVKTGRRQWCFTETTSHCRGADYVEPVNPFPGRDQEVIPNQQPGSAENGAEIPPEEKIEFCKPNRPGGDVVLRLVGLDRSFVRGKDSFIKPLVACGSGAGVPPEKLCPAITGSASWYVSANLFKISKGFNEAQSIREQMVVCRGSGPLERIALANVARVCIERGFSHFVVAKLPSGEPLCVQSPHTPNFRSSPIAISDLCNTLYGTTSWKQIDTGWWCLP